ncbi:hypothetical protein PRUPE_8G047700 [Prunus persica]|uniref:Orn/DAP/Arg decarboxylase 2 N-terminal domain-containing protein n=1 Tax=Prunus persica TaxID=3760 RepID=A0A251MT87_PRUPE|nr:hypothetical protein PRUPE_8G047700 [Prunus persica]
MVGDSHFPSTHQLTTTHIRSIISKRDKHEPFYVLDLGVLVSLMKKWSHCLPNVQPFFVVKCNHDPAFIAALATLGASFDCASKVEIEAIFAHGVSPTKIVYANPCKDEYHLRYAAGVRVDLATFDSMDEVDMIKRCHLKCSLLFRIAVPNDKSSWRSFGTKFGALPEEVAPLLRHAHKLGLRVVGISFHVGSKASEPQACLSDSDLTVMAEPGRFFAKTAFTMVANVMGKRVRGEKREYWKYLSLYASILSVQTLSPLNLPPSSITIVCATKNIGRAKFCSTKYIGRAKFCATKYIGRTTVCATKYIGRAKS